MITRCLIAMSLIASACAIAHADDDTCIFFCAENLAKGPGNWYVPFSKSRYTIQDGDVLEYEIYLPESNPEMKGGIDVQVEGHDLPQELKALPALRESKLKDQNGIRLHGDGILEPARGKWYHRKFDLSTGTMFIFQG